MPCYEMFLSQVGHVFQVMFKSTLCRIHGATTTVEYVFNCIVMCRIHGVTTTVEYVFTRRIHGATTTVEYVFFMLSQVYVEYMGPQQLWSMYLTAL